jgi:signal transduction histidine kinase
MGVRGSVVKVPTVAKILAINDGSSLRGHQHREKPGRALETERMAAIGRRVSSLSHDIRHYLSGIRANMEFLQSPRLEPNDRNELWVEMQDAVLGITDLLDSVLRYASTGQTNPRTRERISNLVENAVAAVKRHPDACAVSIEVDPLPTVETNTDARSIECAIYNLLLNACQAARFSACAPKANVYVALVRERVYISIADNGPGVPAAICKTLFDPFVTAGKPNGTGLGLTLARRAAEEHCGCVSLEESGSGRTVFVLSLERDCASDCK